MDSWARLNHLRGRLLQETAQERRFGARSLIPGYFWRSLERPSLRPFRFPRTSFEALGARVVAFFAWELLFQDVWCQMETFAIAYRLS